MYKQAYKQMEYSYTIKDLQKKSGFSLPLLRKILNEIQPVMDEHFVKGEKNALLFNSNALIVIDQIKQMKDSGMNLPSIKKEIEKSINTKSSVKTEEETHINTSINTNYFKDVLEQVKELYEKNIKTQSEVIETKEQLIKELNNRLLLITDGKPPEVLKAENEKKNQDIIHLGYQVKETSKENEILKNKNDKLKKEMEEKLQIEKNKILENEKLIREKEEVAKILENEKKAIEEKNKLNQEKKNSILKELSDLENKWFVGAKRKDLLKQLQDLS